MLVLMKKSFSRNPGSDAQKSAVSPNFKSKIKKDVLKNKEMN